MERYRVFLSFKQGPWVYEWKNKCAGFIDSNPNKAGDYYYEKKIQLPNALTCDKVDFCIITVEKKESVITRLKELGFTDKQWIFWSDYIEKCWNKAISTIEDVIPHELFTEFEKGSVEKKIEIVSMASDKEDDSLKDRLLYHLLFEYIKKEKDITFFKKFSAYLKWNRVIDRLNWEYGNHVNKIFEFGKAVIPNMCRDSASCIKTIGIYVDRYYGGGIEKVVSLLIPGFINLNYRVILITEEEDRDKDYSVPQGVIYQVLNEKHDGNLEQRLKEFDECIKKYGIDVMCFHSGYSRLNLFYELLYMRIQGVFTVCVIHSAFIALIKDQQKIADKFVYAYRLADRVVTVSEADRFFWQNLGCQCKFIPNPIEGFHTERREIKRHDPPMILWVGRIVQRPKMVLDVIPVMKELRYIHSNAILSIVGGNDDQIIYRKLLSMISEEGLNDSIKIYDYQSDISKLYDDADVVLITSASESFSNVLAEAEAHGKPVVMYDLPWLPLLSDNEGVIRVKQRDYKAAAMKIAELLRNDVLWEKCSAAGKSKISKAIAYDVMREWKDLFDELSFGNKGDDKTDTRSSNVVMELLLEQLCGNGYPYDGNW